MPGDTSGGIVETHVVAFDPHRRGVEPALVRDAVGVSRVEQRPPAPAAGREIVPEEGARCQADQVLRAGPELRGHRGIDLDHAFMRKDVVQHRLLVDLRPPGDRLVDHHEEEPVLRALEERFQKGGGAELGEFGQGWGHRDLLTRKMGRGGP